MKVFIIPILDANHIRTNFIAKANYHVVLKDSQNIISEAWENHHRALKDISEALEQNYLDQKIQVKHIE